MNRRNILALSGIAIISITATAIVTVRWVDHSYTDHISSGKNIEISSEFTNSVTPFTNIAEAALIDGHEVWNDRPGITVFDYDRDGDHDIYITSKFGHPNWLYNNQGDGTFLDMAAIAGVTSESNNSTGVVACDINNDGYQDLYVGSWGLVGDRLDFRSHLEDSFSRDLLFLNNRDSTFKDITSSAFGDSVNLRSTTSISCADVNGDGWSDFFVGNLMDDEFRFSGSSHAGHYNLLYINNGDLTFSEQSVEAGVAGPQIIMRDHDGLPIIYSDPETGKSFEGYDPSITDTQGNRVGDPTGQTHAVLFFDHDDDGDPDLWVANDGDRLHVFRNDSTLERAKFTNISMGTKIDKAGAWMGFAVGDYDGDHDLDVFLTNMGYHPRTRVPVEDPNGTCEYHDQFEWGTCLHFLLENRIPSRVSQCAELILADGHDESNHCGRNNGLDKYSDRQFLFEDVAERTRIVPSTIMPPDSLDETRILDQYQRPTGLAAYDFGFGATFFDFDNDGDQDLYWFGSTIGRGEGPGGFLFPSAGRMLRGDGIGNFQDVTVESRLLDITGVRYDLLGQDFDPKALRIDPIFHKNGKGLAHGDLNNDGYVDLVATNSSGPVYREFPPIKNHDVIPKPGPIFLWLNGGGSHNWITFRLHGRMAVDGTGTNADGIGARVYLMTTDATTKDSLIQVQEVRAGSSYLSMDSIDLEFGLGKASIVDTVLVLWPSGRRQILNNLPVNTRFVVTEPEH